MNRKNQFALSIIIACTLAASSYQGTFADDLDDQLQDIQGQIDESHNSQANWQEIIDQVNVKLRAIQIQMLQMPDSKIFRISRHRSMLR